jgi:hypothetical protein
MILFAGEFRLDLVTFYDVTQRIDRLMNKSAEELFTAALELTNPAERGALLDRECVGNSALRAEVESLLAAHEGHLA